MTAWLKNAGHRLGLFFKSIRFRLTLWTAAILVVILLAFIIFVYYRQEQFLIIDARIQLQEQAQRLTPLYHNAGLPEPGQPAAPLPDPAMLSSGMLSADETLTVLGPDGELLQSVGTISDGVLKPLLQA